MKLLLMNHFPLEGSGSGVYTLNLARAMVGLGHEVQILVPETSPVDTTSEGFITHTVLFREDEGAVLSCDERIKRGAADGVLGFPFPCFTAHPRSHFTFYDMDEAAIDLYREAFKTKLAELLKDFDPDLIHVGHLWILADLARESGRPYVVTSHGTDLMGYKRDERFREMALRTANSACRVITISRQMDEDVERLLSVPPRRRSLIYSGCDTTLFHRMSLSRTKVLKGLGIDEACRYVICFAGKLVGFKGVDVLLEAAAGYEGHLGSAGGVLTVIAGDGVLREELMSKAKCLGLRGVRFVGHQSQSALAALYSVSDVFAMPSRSEPFGLAALEAMACGLPVVGTSSGGLVDMITPDVGSLVPADDPEALASALEAILSLDADQKEALRRRCTGHVETHFSWTVTAKDTEKVYEACLLR
ncbi:glycosyltransferase family 4 protein [Acidaminobacter hydrogenoformans]|uniref:Glycosyltransferase involved in cell wall bisynthesis n=1 Tax=Acidaminobacter hydrogenoformans DSM 2784 TaxID=1120920 RepID=A0A1G5RSF5_9FIRM|nr:glycosyltransferase family 4 protein [Acidaminobacter hydrogenoformans]SCZ76209.1 Glycosyltransferase involved in cell wall bisynthesis [Acidaminobacter hydrogenoformans DSM 2784]